MQRKSTPLSHPFHVLFALLVVTIVVSSQQQLIAAEESSLFHIECPPDVTVDCHAELWDLSIYGNATVYGYSGPQDAGPPVSEDYDLNSCNAGTITRTWVAYDYGGTPYYCSQVIHVTGSGGAVDIHWPPDYMIQSCDPLTHPDDLPEPYDYPVIYGGGSCAQLLTNYEDLVFDINPPACRKILRKWTIIDWCTYDPNSYHPEGIWQHTQIIKIKPTNSPTIVCPSDTMVSAGADCTGGYVQLPPAYGSSDCGAGVIISNNSPYAHNNGADASGVYPVGTTKVTFSADDGCGQKTSCSVYITVTDMKKPTPICFYGISFPLMAMPDGYYMDLRPGFIDKGSFDNCTPKHKLKMWVEPSRVDCDHIGPTEIRLFVEDESGNVEYCTTVINVQDNLDICPPDDGIVDGNVYTASGAMVGDVKVSLAGTQDYAMTDTAGFYAFSGLSLDESYVISPGLHSDDMTGVSAMDLVSMLKHILGVEAFASPYQFIAGDMDKSGRVTVSDLVALRDMIVKDLLSQNPHTSWRFVDAAFSFPNPQDPFASEFPETYQIASLNSDMTALNFIGVKLGDLNDDAVNLGGNLAIETRSPVALNLTETEFQAGEIVETIVSISDFAEVKAMEFALKFRQDGVEILDIDTEVSGYGLDVFHQASAPDIISALWYGVEPLDQDILFRVTLKTLKPGKISEVTALVPATRANVYMEGSELPFKLVLSADGQIVDGSWSQDPAGTMRVGQNFPNPFDNVTMLPVDLPLESPLEVEVFDVNGRMLWTNTFNGKSGDQDIRLEISDKGSHNVLFARVTSDFGSTTVRMLVQP